MITLERMRALEANSAWRGVSRRLLMENAGAQVVRELWKHNPPEERVAIFAGTGNNGGDGFVAARHIINRGVEVDLVLLGRPLDISSPEAQENWQVLSQMDEEVSFYVVRDSKDIQVLSGVKSDVVIDAMLGTGISGELREPIATAVGSINKRKAYTVAVDVPTGLDPVTGEVRQNASKCDLTVTFQDSKPGLEKGDKEYTGDVVAVDIGIPTVAEKRTGPGDVQMAIPPRMIGSHKGQNGRLLVIGGGSQYAGAPALAGLSALQSGADLVTIAAPSGTADIINSFSPDLITSNLPGEDLEPQAVPELEEDLEKAMAVLIGPGLGTSTETRSAVLDLMNTLIEDYPDLPALLDADGLKIVSEEPDLLEKGNCLATPHAGEFELLSGSELPPEERERVEEVSRVARELNTSILLKAYTDICADPDGRVILNDTGNPGMTVGGTGDVLAGIMGAFLSQGAKPFRAGAAGSFLCGLAGDLCSQEMGYEFTASDVKDKVPTAISNAREYW